MMKKMYHKYTYADGMGDCIWEQRPWGRVCINPKHWVEEEVHETEPTYPDFLKKEDKKCAE